MSSPGNAWRDPCHLRHDSLQGGWLGRVELHRNNSTKHTKVGRSVEYWNVGVGFGRLVNGRIATQSAARDRDLSGRTYAHVLVYS